MKPISTTSPATALARASPPTGVISSTIFGNLVMFRRDRGEHGGVAMQVFGGPEVERQQDAGGVIDGPMQAHGGAAGFEPSKGPGVELDQRPLRARGSRRARYCRGRRRCLAGRPRARRSRRTVARLSASPSTSCSFSVAWQSLKSQYVVVRSWLTRCRSRAASRRGDGRPAVEQTLGPRRRDAALPSDSS